MLQNEQIGQLSFSQLAGHSQDRQNTQDAFSQICRAYVKVDACLEQCEKTSESSARVRQTVLRVAALPSSVQRCRFEPVAMQECRREINESLVASNRFSTTVMRKEQHNLRNHFESLCSFEQLYSQLGISDQLPASCKSLLSLRRRIPEPRVRTASTKEFEHAPQITSIAESTNLSAIFFLICTIITY
ncbi:unnamed protein product [Nippostrongylus brasiliensis]|uniref:CPG4 domain-containing protein n=1 Tax=Nippostrongylus brasiliensis TaxID=27835 RepID=A0A0N4Y3U5_NIPBR|nr:unnamed protein product [Nippostrongylus brasiliensis]